MRDDDLRRASRRPGLPNGGRPVEALDTTGPQRSYPRAPGVPGRGGHGIEALDTTGPQRPYPRAPGAPGRGGHGIEALDTTGPQRPYPGSGSEAYPRYPAAALQATVFEEETGLAGEGLDAVATEDLALAGYDDSQTVVEANPPVALDWDLPAEGDLTPEEGSWDPEDRPLGELDTLINVPQPRVPHLHNSPPPGDLDAGVTTQEFGGPAPRTPRHLALTPTDPMVCITPGNLQALGTPTERFYPSPTDAGGPAPAGAALQKLSSIGNLPTLGGLAPSPPVRPAPAAPPGALGEDSVPTGRQRQGSHPAVHAAASPAAAPQARQPPPGQTPAQPTAEDARLAQAAVRGPGVWFLLVLWVLALISVTVAVVLYITR